MGKKKKMDLAEYDREKKERVMAVEKEEMKEENELIVVKVKTLSEEPDKVPPLIGYFPSGFDPLEQRGITADNEPPAKVRVLRHQKRTNRLQLVVSPNNELPVDFVGTNYSGEAATPQLCTYALGVFDKESKMLKVVPIASNKIFRLEPKIRGADIYDEEPSRGDFTAEKKADKAKDLTNMYSTKKSINQAKKRELLYNSENPDTVEDLEQKIEEIKMNKEAIESSGFHNIRNIPPHDTSATTCEMAYPLNKIILTGEWDYLLDILELSQLEQDLAPDEYPSFVRNRFHQLEDMKDDAEKKRLACVLSYITHLIKFKDKHSMDGVSSAKYHKFPSILQQKFSSMFADSNAKRLQEEKKDLLISYVLVLTLFADDFRTDPSDIARDLRMNAMKLRPHYEYLGCKPERDGTVTRFTLPLPLEFPKIRARRRR